MQYKRTIFRGICVTVLLAVSAGFMISKFVAVNEMNQQVASLKSQLTTLESATSQMVFDLEQSVDLTKIEKEATTRLGMQRPEKYQTIYVNVKQDDMTEKTAGEVEGFGHGIVSVLKKIGGNIVQFFQHKNKKWTSIIIKIMKIGSWRTCRHYRRKFSISCKKGGSLLALIT